MKRNSFWLCIHPFLFGVYPVIALLGHNIGQIRPIDALRSLILMIFFVGVLVSLMWLLYRDGKRAALAASLFLFLFFLYENLYLYTKGVTVLSVIIGRHRILFPMFIGFMLLGLHWIRKEADNSVPISQFFSLVGVVALSLPLFQIGSSEITRRTAVFSDEASVRANQPALRRDFFPDIYFIVLDGYARDDILEDYFNFDNTPFLSELENLGFYIPSCSQSNYSKTFYTIPAILNLNYLDVLGRGDVTKTAGNIDIIDKEINDSTVQNFLEQYGYHTVAFPTGFAWSEIETADTYLLPESDDLRLLGSWNPLETINPFESLLIHTSFDSVMDLLLLLGVDIRTDIGGGETKTKIEIDVYRKHYDTVLFALDALEKTPNIPGPKFVYAHIVSPHPPNVFDQFGNYYFTGDLIKGYVEQVKYLNQRMLATVHNILEVSDSPPIIILISDHGAKEFEWTPEVMYNLGAYYFPEGGDQFLYPTITAVNSFRIIFDYYFGTELGLVEDISYNSLSEESPLEFLIVPNNCPYGSAP